MGARRSRRSARVLVRDLHPCPDVKLAIFGLSSSSTRRAGRDLTLEAADWLRPEADLLELDRRVHEAESHGSFALVLTGSVGEVTRAAPQILARYQRLVPQRNQHSSGDLFRSVLAHHRAIHRIDLPLVRADWEHAIDTWQWILRLDPEAGLAVQLAALLHDIERLGSEPERRVEHLAPDYPTFKLAHAAQGGALVQSLLQGLDAPPPLTEQVVRLVAQHEAPVRPDTPGADDRGSREALALVNDADALSFFSLNSAGFLAYYGPEHTALKVEYTLARMRPSARKLLGLLKHPAPVERMLHRVYRRVIAAQNSANSSGRRGGLV